MLTRCIKLKLVVPRRGDCNEARDLWTTHEVINAAVAGVESVLLLCRGRGYVQADGERVNADAVQTQALRLARQIQADHAKRGAGSDDEILLVLRQLFEELVPSCLLDEHGNPRTGNAQQSRGFVGPLMNPESVGFQGLADEIVEPLPAWTAGWQADREKAERESLAWLTSDVGRVLLNKPRRGRPPGWVPAAQEGRPWQEKFIRDQKKKRSEMEGVAGVFDRMRQLGLLPLMRPPVKSRLVTKNAAVTPWDYLAMRLAVGHLLSWESWNHRAAKEHAEIKTRVDQQRQIVTRHGAAVKAIREYERGRHELLKQVALASDERPFRIGPRTLRAWDRVRERWLSAGTRTGADRKAALATLQTELRGRFGDPHLFGWLAEEPQESLWRGADPLPEIARLNALEGLLARKRDQAVLTVSEARLHPRWVQYGAKGDANLRNYELSLTQEPRHLEITLPGLHRNKEQLEEVQLRMRVAPSGQFESPVFGGGRTSPVVTFGPLDDRMKAIEGSADILFSRRQLENRPSEQLVRGRVGPVWLKLALDVESKAPADWLDGRGGVIQPAGKFHFQSALAERSKYADQVQPGLRILSVDLGVRFFAACSVFELTDRQPSAGLFFEINEPAGLWAKHERSFLLALPGESPSAEQQEARITARSELRALGRAVSQLAGLLRLSIETDPPIRRSILQAWLAEVLDPRTPGEQGLLTEAQLRELLDIVDAADERWATQVRSIHRLVERQLGLRIGEWRAGTRARRVRAYRGGKSVWAVEYLTEVRRLLQRWSRHARQQGQIRRADRERGGIFAASLLAHLNALKEDRVKTGADLLVQAARGFRACDPKGWVKDYEPCRLILFEDLARYRFRIDRPRFENSQLMKWSHRKIFEQTEMQAEIYGISVDATSAGFSSRFHARTGAPGVRSRLVGPADLKDAFLRQRIQQEIDAFGVSIDDVQPGDQIPWTGGPVFVTFASGNGAATCAIHADINAAQNLQRRFWTRCGDAYRLTAIRRESAAGPPAYYSAPVGKRLLGALQRLTGRSGPYRLAPASDSDGFVLETVSPKAWSPADVGQLPTGDEDLSEVEADLADELGDLVPTAACETFFRDPSGLVLPSDRWYQQKQFWGSVRGRIGRALLDRRVQSPF